MVQVSSQKCCWLLICLAFCFLLNNIAAQIPHEFDFENKVYDAKIRTVQLHMRGAPLTLPIVNLDAKQGSMVLNFDVLDAELRDFMYTIVHCTADWQASALQTNDYLTNFTEDRIIEFSPSQNTLLNYVNYTLALPNRNIGWAVSGNYMLVVWDEDTEEVVFTRRFMVVEPGWRVEAQFVRPAKVEKQDTHHEIDFRVVHEGTRVSVPQQEVKAVVLQNGRWDNAVGLLPPFAALGESLSFDYQDKVVFPAGKEFRFFDIQQFDSRRANVLSIQRPKDTWEITLRTERNYAYQPYQFWGDLNGRYSIENQTQPGNLLACEYVRVLFSIAAPQPLFEQDVYVFGELTEWQLKPEFKMVYSEAAKVYYCEALLKQGFYNYEIVVANPRTGELDLDGFSGNWHETSNQYTVLVYYRPFGERFDRLMVAATIDSRSRN